MSLCPCQSVRLPTLVPPHTYSTWPVTKPACSATKKRTACATSAGWPSRLTGMPAAICAHLRVADRDDAVEHVGLDRPRRHHVDRDADGRQLQRPGARHAQHAGLGGGVGGARGQAERAARGQQHDAAEAGAPSSPAGRPAPAGWRLDRWMSTRVSRSASFTSCSSAGRITPALWITVSGAKRCATSSAACAVAARSARSTSMLCSCACVEARRAARHRHHRPAVVQQLAADLLADAGTAAGDHRHALPRRVHARPGPRAVPEVSAFGRPCGAHDAATNASTRNGLPLPFWIFSGGQISIAPVGGSRSRLLRHCRP